jgi:hypothetical protein
MTAGRRGVTFIVARQYGVRVKLDSSRKHTGQLRKRMPCDTHVKGGPVP